MAAPRIFIYRATSDEEFVNRLSDLLKRRKYEVFSGDKATVVQRRSRVIKRAIRQSHLIILVLSKASANDTDLIHLLNFAQQKKRPLRSILKQDCMMPPRISALPQIDFSKSEKEGFIQLTAELDKAFTSGSGRRMNSRSGRTMRGGASGREVASSTPSQSGLDGGAVRPLRKKARKSKALYGLIVFALIIWLMLLVLMM